MSIIRNSLSFHSERENDTPAVFIPSKEYIDGKVFYVFYKEKLRACRINQCLLQIDGWYLSSSLLMEVGGIDGVIKLNTFGRRFYKSIEDYSHDLTFDPISKLVPIREIYFHLFGFLKNRGIKIGTLKKSGYKNQFSNVVRFYVNKLDGSICEKQVNMIGRIIYDRNGISLEKEVFDDLKEVIKDTYPTYEECLLSRSCNFVPLEDKKEKDNKPTLVLKGDGNVDEQILEFVKMHFNVIKE